MTDSLVAVLMTDRQGLDIHEKRSVLLFVVE